MNQASWQERIQAGLAEALLRLSTPLPDRLRSRLGRGLGHLVRLALPRPRRIAMRNLELCFPELRSDQRRALLREHFCQLGEAALELGPLWRGPRIRFEQLFAQIEGLEHVERAKAQGQGLILLSAHFGSWEAGALYMSLLTRLTALYMPTHNPAFSTLMVAGRSRFGATMTEKKRGFRPLIAALRRGEAIGILADQNVNEREGVFAPFFGMPASTSVAVAHLAKRSGVPVIYVFAFRLPRGAGFRLVFRPLPADYPCGNDETDATTMNAMLETAIREAPAQYWWVHRRFKTRPQGLPDPYA
ncbi:lysophospholipid acyltransferase family protein [Thermithiobacillus plumbiphilus]|uniref:Lysophospholipid acyltransferase family protein n=1 Tax=Thermithiobacillus plumbiphilus TaxID=1729899 RepID=A0ABU9DAI8_9PROT